MGFQKKCLLILNVSIILISHINSYEHWTNVTDTSFDYETSDKETKWFLFFYKENCKICNEVYSMINSIMKLYIDKPVGFCSIDSLNNPWLNLRFNVTYLPKILLLENNLMYKFHSSYNEKNLVNFIDKKKPLEYSFTIPKGAKIRYVLSLYIPIVSHKINLTMQLILNKFHIPLTWNKYYTLFFLFIFSVLLSFILIKLIVLYFKILYAFFCCGLCQRKKYRLSKSEDIDKRKNKKSINEKIKND